MHFSSNPEKIALFINRIFWIVHYSIEPRSCILSRKRNQQQLYWIRSTSAKHTARTSSPDAAGNQSISFFIQGL